MADYRDSAAERPAVNAAASLATLGPDWDTEDAYWQSAYPERPVRARRPRLRVLSRRVPLRRRARDAMARAGVGRRGARLFATTWAARRPMTRRCRGRR